jgi:hypothetical protein
MWNKVANTKGRPYTLLTASARMSTPTHIAAMLAKHNAMVDVVAKVRGQQMRAGR